MPWEGPSSGGNCEIRVLPTAHHVTLGTVISDLGFGFHGCNRAAVHLESGSPPRCTSGRVTCPAPYDAHGGHAGFL
ncbi:hypothetical protein VULLAG_LOCUS22062 [Vulpes lagopus]